MEEKFHKYLPKMDKLLQKVQEDFPYLGYPKPLVKKALSNLLERQREAIEKGTFKEEEDLFSNDNFWLPFLQELVLLSQPSMKRVINGTGTVIHTNLGRAPLSSHILKEITPFLTSYSDLEFDLTTGERGKREKHLNRQELFKDTNILVVNNNAAACFLVLNTLAKGKEVIVSRGELVEIGGSFRIPEIIRESGVILREVGTTNKTRLKDYETAITENTALIIKVHRSNFVIEGFTEEVPSEQLQSLAKKYNLLFYYDIGSGAIELLKDIASNEPIVERELKKGIDIITFSGDKLLGGTQAGIILANKELIGRLRSNPLYRVLRPDKFTIYYLTRLFYYLSVGDVDKSPVIANLLCNEETINARAMKLQRALKRLPQGAISIEKDLSAPGGGSLPGLYLPTYVVKISHPTLKEEKVRELLLQKNPPILTRLKDGKVIIDLRTVFDSEIKEVAKAVLSLFT